ncbi:hypothetical protein HDK90DRAFT_467258 [Phyllosticta capitalensis]|uniref:Uncharacterized protein n=1 Tax=Phyllosticta capitalensis TaxID=121624 RepID=A0ABR1YJS1_9PEZI
MVRRNSCLALPLPLPCPACSRVQSDSGRSIRARRHESILELQEQASKRASASIQSVGTNQGVVLQLRLLAVGTYSLALSSPDDDDDEDEHGHHHCRSAASSLVDVSGMILGGFGLEKENVTHLRTLEHLEPSENCGRYLNTGQETARESATWD